MEKLEAALAKARELRKSAIGGGDVVRSRTATAAAPVTATGWEDLPEVAISPEMAQRNRITALSGGKNAAPYDMLRSRAVRMMKDKGWTRLAVTSPEAGCGKSTVTLNLAISLARQKDLKVMLLDLDLRRPSLHRTLGYTPEKSLHDYLGGEAEFEQTAVRIGENCLVSLNATVSKRPAELLQSQAARDALDAAIADRAGAESEYKAKIAEERGVVLGELAELEHPLNTLQDRNDRLTVRAPIAGVVNAVNVNGHGDVVRPGGVVAEITPTGAKLFAEVRIAPKDIGHIAPGQKTDITVTTFDPNRYGKITGTVSHISADNFTDERTGEAYYIAYVSLDEQMIGKGAKARALTPGMQVRAEIVTHTRTLMQYVMKPVVRSLDHA